MEFLIVDGFRIWKSIKYKNRMIKSAHMKQPVKDIAATANKESHECSKSSESLTDSQSIEASWEGKAGLLECLMSSESAEIKRLNS